MKQTEPASPLLEGLSVSERRHVLETARRRRVRTGQTLFRQDEPAESLCFVESGRLKLVQVTSEGDEVIVRIGGPGAVFAAIAVLEGSAYPFDARAVAASSVLLWSRRTVRELLRTVPRLEANLLGIVASHSREMMDRFRELATEAVPQRVARTLLRLAATEGRAGPEGLLLDGLTRRDLAEVAATSLFTVSRLLSRWDSRGILRAGRGKVWLLLLPTLEALAAGTDVDANT